LRAQEEKKIDKKSKKETEDAKEFDLLGGLSGNLKR